MEEWISWKEYEARLWKKWLAETRKLVNAEQAEQVKKDFELSHPAKTKRDDYGWRSLPGTSWIGPQQGDGKKKR